MTPKRFNYSFCVVSSELFTWQGYLRVDNKIINSNFRGKICTKLILTWGCYLVNKCWCNKSSFHSHSMCRDKRDKRRRRFHFLVKSFQIWQSIPIDFRWSRRRLGMSCLLGRHFFLLDCRTINNFALIVSLNFVLFVLCVYTSVSVIERYSHHAESILICELRI